MKFSTGGCVCQTFTLFPLPAFIRRCILTCICVFVCVQIWHPKCANLSRRFRARDIHAKPSQIHSRSAIQWQSAHICPRFAKLRHSMACHYNKGLGWRWLSHEGWLELVSDRNVPSERAIRIAKSSGQSQISRRGFIVYICIHVVVPNIFHIVYIHNSFTFQQTNVYNGFIYVRKVILKQKSDRIKCSKLHTLCIVPVNSLWA